MNTILAVYFYLDHNTRIKKKLNWDRRRRPTGRYGKTGLAMAADEIIIIVKFRILNAVVNGKKNNYLRRDITRL